jgi:tRNA-2-methylthio-N6-dimethylallyladenosine synthase
LNVLAANAQKLQKFDLPQGTNKYRSKFPIQSGSELVLKLMERAIRLRIARPGDCLTEAMPELVFTTHFIVRFPGETAADLEDTINLGKAFDFKNITVYKYDDQPNTPASKFPNKISLLGRSRRLLC